MRGGACSLGFSIVVWRDCFIRRALQRARVLRAPPLSFGAIASYDGHYNVRAFFARPQTVCRQFKELDHSVLIFIW